MKNEILDSAFHDSFPDFLEKGEKIIWEGKPRFKTKFFEVFFGDKKAITLAASLLALFVFVGFFSIFFIPILMGIWEAGLSVKIVASIVLLSLCFYPFMLFLDRKKTRYFITNRRIIFQLAHQGITDIYRIPFSNIQGLVVQQEGKNAGVIFLSIKNPQRVEFETYNLRSGERRHQPTLEMIEDVEEVAGYIRLGIQNQLS